MKTKSLSIIVVAMILISLTVAAQKTERKRDRFDRSERTMKRGMRGGDVNSFFTEEQEETIKALRLETEKEVKPLRNQLNELQAHQVTITTAEKSDLNAINKNIDQMSDVKTKMAKIMAKQQQDIRTMLTEEQLLKFDNLRGNRMNNRGRDFGRNGQTRRMAR